MPGASDSIHSDNGGNPGTKFLTPDTKRGKHRLKYAAFSARYAIHSDSSEKSDTKFAALVTKYAIPVIIAGNIIN